MELGAILDSDCHAGRILDAVLDRDSISRFQRILSSGDVADMAMGLSQKKRREVFTEAIRAFYNARGRPVDPQQDREFVGLLPTRTAPPSLSPTAVTIQEAFEIATKLKLKLDATFGRALPSMPATTRLDMLADSLAHACHMVDRDMKLRMSYRDHYVHPIAVVAFGVHVLLYQRSDGEMLLEKATRALFQPATGTGTLAHCVPGGPSALSRALRIRSSDADDAACEKRCAFVLLSWILGATYHDIGRHILTIALVQSSNVCSTGDAERPVFGSYVSKSCFGNNGDPLLKRCACHYPPRNMVGPFERFVDNVMPAMSALVRDRLNGGIGSCLNGLAFINPEADHPKTVDHAILSSLELFTWGQSLQAGLSSLQAEDRSERIILASACKLAAATALPHHVGAKVDSRPMLNSVTFESNPLAVLLRLVDFFHSACRPFLAYPEYGTPRGTVQAMKMQFKLNETATTLTIHPIDSDGPIPFRFEIYSRLEDALWMAVTSAKPLALIDAIRRQVNGTVQKVKTEYTGLRGWLCRNSLGAELVIRPWDVGR